MYDDTSQQQDRAGADSSGGPGGAEAGLRLGRSDDVAAVIRMHQRCSWQTLQRRFHVPMPHLSGGRARHLLRPEGGLWLVAATGGEVIGLLTLGRADPDTFEVGVLVEDAWQHSGIGTRLVRTAAPAVSTRGARDLVLVTQPDNAAVRATVRRAGLDARVRVADGLLTITAGAPHAAATRPSAARTRCRRRAVWARLRTPRR